MILRKTTELLTSVKTSVVVFIIAIAFFLAGTLSAPHNMEAFSDITDKVLFSWLAGGGKPLSVTWWIYALIGVIAFMALNIIVCGADTLIRKLPAKRLVAVLSPQIIHLGVIMILFAHMLTASVGMRKEIFMSEGQSVQVSNGVGVQVSKIIVRPSHETDMYWEVRGSWIDEGGEAAKPVVLKASQPSYFRGTWLFIKNADMARKGADAPVAGAPGGVEGADAPVAGTPGAIERADAPVADAPGAIERADALEGAGAPAAGAPTVTFMAHRDPGVLWAFAGGAVVALGCVLFPLGRPFGVSPPREEG